jgi:hypothetical protein
MATLKKSFAYFKKVGDGKNHLGVAKVKEK